MKTKICGSCSKELDISNFHKQSSNKTSNASAVLSFDKNSNTELYVNKLGYLNSNSKLC
jgi:hypothetical protein